jgi:PAS domain S-box-containing protein
MKNKPAPPLEYVFKDSGLNPSTQALTLADVREPNAPLVYINAGFEKLTGYTRDEAIGRNCRFLQGPETSSEAVVLMGRAIREGTTALLDVLNYRKDGSSFWNRLSLTPVKDNVGRVTHYIGIQSDITGMRVLQERLHDIALELVSSSEHHLD